MNEDEARRWAKYYESTEVQCTAVDESFGGQCELTKMHDGMHEWHAANASLAWPQKAHHA